MSELLNNPTFVLMFGTLIVICYGAFAIGEIRDCLYIERRSKRAAKEMKELAGSCEVWWEEDE